MYLKAVDVPPAALQAVPTSPEPAPEWISTSAAAALIGMTRRGVGYAADGGDSGPARNGMEVPC